MKTNVLYYGDNLEILRNREYFPDESVDLIYLDPPFNSKKDYNILFKENGGVESEAQIKAFTDSWHWAKSAQDTYQDIVINGPTKVGGLIGALHEALGNNDVMAYLVMMTARLIELHRVLKSTGSLYLHCDPTASHYLKLVLDQIFGPVNFRNEIVWKRTSAHSGSKKWGPVHDVILLYSKSENFNWNFTYTKYNKDYVKDFYRFEDETGRYQLGDLTGAGIRNGDSGKPWRGVDPNIVGRHWAVPNKILKEQLGEDISSLNVQEKLETLDKAGFVYWPSKGKIPRLKRYYGEDLGVSIVDVITDIYPMGSQAKERLGYETQKPLALLERIIQASSNEGDVVLDPFCGCGTAVVAAQKLKRKWIGIDITTLATNLMRNRLKDSFGIDAEIIGEPADLGGAKELASQPDKYQFQWWALGLIGARPLGDKKKGADKGIDGVISFIDDPTSKPKRTIVQVKSGHVGVDVIKVLETTAAKEAMGILITLEPPTKPMQVEAVSAGYYHSPIWNKDYPKIQILTIEGLLHGKIVEMPPLAQTNVTFTKAQKISKKEGEQLIMEG
jgi:site-specific DNA-methyltransferase (adenine-specific)